MAKTLSDLQKRVSERTAELRSVLTTSQKSLDNINQIMKLAKEEGIEDTSIDRLVTALQKALVTVEEAVNEPISKK